MAITDKPAAYRLLCMSANATEHTHCQQACFALRNQIQSYRERAHEGRLGIILNNQLPR